MINCKKFRFYNRFTVDFTVVGGQIGCPYFFTVFFFFFFLQCTKRSSYFPFGSSDESRRLYFRLYSPLSSRYTITSFDQSESTTASKPDWVAERDTLNFLE